MRIGFTLPPRLGTDAVGKKGKKREKKERNVKLHTLDYDAQAEEYILTESRTTFPELPRGAVHITGRKNEYFWDRSPHPERDGGITAADLCLYMINNSINDALAYKWDPSQMDMRKILIYGIAGIVLVCVVYAMM